MKQFKFVSGSETSGTVTIFPLHVSCLCFEKHQIPTTTKSLLSLWPQLSAAGVNWPSGVSGGLLDLWAITDNFRCYLVVLYMEHAVLCMYVLRVVYIK